MVLHVYIPSTREFEPSLGYILRLYLKNKQKTWSKHHLRVRHKDVTILQKSMYRNNARNIP